MTQIKLKRVYEDYDKNDGYRVLVDKLWPRGMKKENLHYDRWEKDITPSTELREWFHQAPDNRWKDFSTAYMKELEHSQAAKQFAHAIKSYGTVTLLFAAKDVQHTHAIILKDFLEKEMAQ